MTIQLPIDLETAIAGEARRLGTTPDVVVERALRQHFPDRTPLRESQTSEKALEKMRRLLAVARPCGVAMSNEALSSEGLYD